MMLSIRRRMHGELHENELCVHKLQTFFVEEIKKSNIHIKIDQHFGTHTTGEFICWNPVETTMKKKWTHIKNNNNNNSSNSNSSRSNQPVHIRSIYVSNQTSRTQTNANVTPNRRDSLQTHRCLSVAEEWTEKKRNFSINNTHTWNTNNNYDSSDKKTSATCRTIIHVSENSEKKKYYDKKNLTIEMMMKEKK